MKKPDLVPFLLTQKQTAMLLNVSVKTVQRLEADGKLQRVPIGEKLAAKHRRPGDKPAVRFKRSQVLELAENGWVWGR